MTFQTSDFLVLKDRSNWWEVCRDTSLLSEKLRRKGILEVRKAHNMLVHEIFQGEARSYFNQPSCPIPTCAVSPPSPWSKDKWNRRLVSKKWTRPRYFVARSTPTPKERIEPVVFVARRVGKQHAEADRCRIGFEGGLVLLIVEPGDDPIPAHLWQEGPSVSV